MTLRLAIIGRPNVGKSTLFNRMAKKKLAIIDDTPGVTRDWRETDGWIYDKKITLIDTAGLEEKFDKSIEARMRTKTEEALGHANLVLFMIDGRSGLNPLDEHFADWLRRQKIPVILCVNKCENETAAAAGISEAWTLGLGEPIAISSAHGHGLNDLYQAILQYIPEDKDDDDDDKDIYGINLSGEELDKIEGNVDFDFAEGIEEKLEEIEEKPIKLAIVGRPNVGKSTLMNALLGEERVMTGPEAGITRDAIAAYLNHEGKEIRIVDTAGLRKKARITNRIEKMAADDSLRAIRLAQVVVLVIDGNKIMDKQDLIIARHVINEGRALIIAVNKWDAVKDREQAREDVKYKIRTSLGQLKDVKIVMISAIRRRKLDKLMDTVLYVYKTWHSRLPTGKLNRWLSSMESHHPPPLVSNRPNKLKYIAQIKSRPPTFALWCSKPDELPETYKRYIINGIKEDFGIEAVPIRIHARTSKNPYS